jgi:hypothetical protein
MIKCDKCDKEATTHVVEVRQDSGKVKTSNFCDEHAPELDCIAVTEGFVVKALRNAVDVSPRWLSAEDGHRFGPREKAILFPTHAAAKAEAQKWDAMLRPALDVVVEPA